MNNSQKQDIAIMAIFGAMGISAIIGIIVGEKHHLLTLIMSFIMTACAARDYIEEKRK